MGKPITRKEGIVTKLILNIEKGFYGRIRNLVVEIKKNSLRKKKLLTQKVKLVRKRVKR